MRTPTLLLTTFVLLTSLWVNAQIEATFTGAADMPVILASYHGDRLAPVDTTLTDAKGRVRFEISLLRQGQYRLVFGKGNGTDLLFHHQPVNLQFDITTGTTLFADTLNMDYQQLLQQEEKHQKKLALLTKLLDEYPADDPFYQKISAQYVKQQIDRSAFLNGLIRGHYKDILGKMAQLMKKPFMAPELDSQGRNVYLRDHFWDMADMSDTTLIATNLYPRKAIEFLTLYSNPDYEKDELQASFITGINELIPHINQQPAVFAFLMEYLIAGFEQFGFEDVLQYLATVYESEGCTDEASRQRLAGKVEIIKRMAIGNTAPPLSGKLPDGNTFSLTDLNESYVVVIFWASWCPHCSEIMPVVAELYGQQTAKQFEVLAYSFDNKQEDWKKAIEKQNYEWINISELNGWNSRASDDWGIFATPTMIVLGPGRTIIAKPYNLNELKSKLAELGLITL